MYNQQQVLKTLNHPNIIHLEDTYETADRIYMVMEMMMGGELFDYVVEKGTLSEEEASVIVRKVTSAVAHMHGLDIIHRDLKPENLVITEHFSNYMNFLLLPTFFLILITKYQHIFYRSCSHQRDPMLKWNW